MNKKQLLEEIDTALAQHIEEMRKCVCASQEMMQDAPGRIESRYDTSREEMGWLASGQSALLGELERNYAAFKTIGSDPKDCVRLGAFFEAESLADSFRIRCLVCNGGSGFECETSQGTIMLISPSSPLATAALGRSTNEAFTVNGNINYVIRDVA